MGNNQTIAANTSSLPFNYFQQGQDWSVDASGLEQSPIDIVSNQAKCSNLNMKMEFFLADHALTGLQVTDVGTSLLVNGAFSKLRATDINGQVYEFEAIQFHFHAPAEHTINGGRYPLELHIVHKMTAESKKNATTQRELAVVGIFFEIDTSANPTPNAFIESLKLNNIGCPFNINMHEVLGGELKDMMTYYAYKGSLTTPPCSETANWYVFEQPLKITEAQMNLFNQRWINNPCFGGGYGNNRPVQPLNGRVVMKSTNCCIAKTSMEPSRQEVPEVKENSVRILYGRDIRFEDLTCNTQLSRSNTEGFIDSPMMRNKKSKEASEKDLPDAPSFSKKLSGFRAKENSVCQDFYSI